MNGLLQMHRRIAIHGATRPLEWLLLLLLIPFSLLYGAASWLRNRFYDWGWWASYRSAVPVVSVGNIAAGGTGKTPVVDWLVKEFLRQGKRPAVVSRGYGGSFASEVGVVSDGEALLLTAAESGDEPFLLALRNRSAVVLVARKRAAGVRRAVAEFGADIVILDDGFQHRAVKRDLDLVLLDATRPFGNRWPLPAGMLREFPRALKRADVLLLTRATDRTGFVDGNVTAYRSRHQLADEYISLRGEKLPVAQLKEKRVFAFAGIAEPENFFSALLAAGLSLAGCLPLGDHCKYTAQILAEIGSAAAGCDVLLTTEKDAVKLSAGMFAIPCYQVPMEVSIEEQSAFTAELQQRIWSER